MSRSNLETETMAVMRGEPPGAAMRLACQDFEKFWQDALQNQFEGRFVNKVVEARCKDIARIAYLEGRGL